MNEELLGPLEPMEDRYLQIRERGFWAMARFEKAQDEFSDRPEDEERLAALDQAAAALTEVRREFLAATEQAKAEGFSLARFDAFKGGFIDARYKGTVAGGDFQWLGFGIYSREDACLVVHSEDIEADFRMAFVLTLGDATWSSSLDHLVHDAEGLLEWAGTALGPRIQYVKKDGARS